MSDFEIVELDNAGTHDRRWNEYVESVPNASLYHRLEWRAILAGTFGHPTRYLMAVQQDRVRGVCPLMEMRSALFGHFFVSLPFVNYGGIVADTPEIEASLATAAARTAAAAGARHIEFRQSHAGNGWPVANAEWSLRQHKAALVVRLDTKPETHWTGISSRLRGKVRKAEKSGAIFSVAGSGGLDDFYRVFALNMRDLGTPVYSPSLFRNILQMSPGSAVLLVHREGCPVAAAIALRAGKRVELPWICSDYSQSSYFNEFLYWKAIEWASAAGASELDFGRSSIDSGTYLFKLQWNPEVRPLFWYYWLAAGTSLPELNPSNPKYDLAVRLWKKMPLAIANRVGPWLVRNIP